MQSGIAGGFGGGLGGAVPAVAFAAVPQSIASGSSSGFGTAPKIPTNIQVIVRKEFPETWIWEEINKDRLGLKLIHLKVVF